MSQARRERRAMKRAMGYKKKPFKNKATTSVVEEMEDDRVYFLKVG